MGKRPLVLLAGLMVCGCALERFYLAKDYVRPQRIAVLPMNNESNDLDGPDYVRKLLFAQLSVRGFEMVPLAEIDEKLKAQGFTNGGELKAVTPQKIGEWVGADALFYSTLEDFNYITLGYYSQRTVKIDAQLIDAHSGKKMWEAERGAASRFVATNKKQAEKEFAVQLAMKAVEKAMHTPLPIESRHAVGLVVETLP